MYDALTVAKYIVTKCVQDGCPISNLQLQKILYFVQLDSLKQTKLPAFSDDIEAWKFGPVVPDVYYHFCGFGALPILATYKINPELASNSSLNNVVKRKREMDPWDLVEEAHEPGKPWATIFKNGEGNRSVIPIDLIRDLG